MEGQGCCKEKSANACSTENSCSTEKTGSCGSGGGCGCGTAGCSGGCGGKSQCCPGALIKGALIGGVIIFAWFGISWMLLPWHTPAAGAAPAGHDPKTLGEYFLFSLVAAALLTKILKKRKAGCCPVAGSVVVGLLVAIFNHIPNLIWMHAPVHDALVGMADDIIAITLAGAAIGNCTLKSHAGKCADGKDAGSCGDKKTGSCH